MRQLQHNAFHEVRTSIRGDTSESGSIFLSAFFYCSVFGEYVQIGQGRNISPRISGYLAEEQWLSDRRRATGKGCCRYP